MDFRLIFSIQIVLYMSAFYWKIVCIKIYLFYLGIKQMNFDEILIMYWIFFFQRKIN